MKITIKTLSGQNFPLDVEPNETILQMKEKIFQAKNFEVGQQKLLRKGQLLQDEKTATEIGIVEGDFLVVMVNVKKQPVAQQPQQQVPQVHQPPQQLPPQMPPQQLPPVQMPPAQQVSSLASGPEYEAALTEMVSMGFSREEAQAAMKAAFNNPERAIDYLLNGIPANLGSEPVSQPVGGDEAFDLGALANNPQLQQIRQLYQQNPQAFMQVLPQLMQSIEQQNPQLFEVIQQNPQAFMAALLGGGGQQGPGPAQIAISPEEKEQIDNIVAMGFAKSDVVEAFLACDRNAEMALNYLFERQATGELLSQHIEREQNNPGDDAGHDHPDDDDDDIYH